MGDNPNEKMIVLFAEDDVDDRALVKEAFEESELTVQLYFVDDGEELMNYLQRKEKYTDAERAPIPDIILLDLNMPRRDGWWALQQIKGDPVLNKIPLIVFTTSNDEEDIIRSYELGASSYITKPASFDKLKEVVERLEKYWFRTVQLPQKSRWEYFNEKTSN